MSTPANQGTGARTRMETDSGRRNGKTTPASSPSKSSNRESGDWFRWIREYPKHWEIPPRFFYASVIVPIALFVFSANVRVELGNFVLRQFTIFPALIYAAHDAWVVCNSVHYEGAFDAPVNYNATNVSSEFAMEEWAKQITAQINPHPDLGNSPFSAFLCVFVAAVTFPVWSSVVEKSIMYFKSKFLLREDASAVLTMIMKPLARVLSSKLAVETISLVSCLVFYWLFQYPSQAFSIARSPPVAVPGRSNSGDVWNSSILSPYKSYDIRQWLESKFIPISISDPGLLSQNPADLPGKGSVNFERWQFTVSVIFWCVPLLYRYAVKSKTVETPWIFDKLSVGVYWFANGLFSIYPVLLENGLSVFQGVLMALQLVFPVVFLGFVIDRLPALLEVSSKVSSGSGNQKMLQMFNIATRLVFVLLTVLLLGVPLGRQLGYALLLGTRSSATPVTTRLFEMGLLLVFFYILYLYLAAIYWLYYQSPFFKIAWNRPSNLAFHRFGRDDSFLSKVSEIMHREHDEAYWETLANIASIGVTDLEDETIVLDADLGTDNESSRDLRLARIRINGCAASAAGSLDLFEITIGGRPRNVNSPTRISDIHVRPHRRDDKITVRIIITLKAQFFQLASAYMKEFAGRQGPRVMRYFFGGEDADETALNSVNVTANFTRNLSSDSIFKSVLPDIPLNIFSAVRTLTTKGESIWDCTSDVKDIIGDDITDRVQNGLDDLSDGLQGLISEDIMQVQQELGDMRESVEHDAIKSRLERIEKVLQEFIDRPPATRRDVSNLLKRSLASSWNLYKQIKKLKQDGKTADISAETRRSDEMVNYLFGLLRKVITKTLPLVLHQALSEAMTAPSMQGLFSDLDHVTAAQGGLTAQMKFLLLSAVGLCYIAFQGEERTDVLSEGGIENGANDGEGDTTGRRGSEAAHQQPDNSNSVRASAPQASVSGGIGWSAVDSTATVSSSEQTPTCSTADSVETSYGATQENTSVQGIEA
eukprot:gb/GECG01008892.1/.p1 GENE.gb/GECG01008892.1/~~gb/GECG01008892.1/.p1  ORF type:complete len:991 (+),score=95.62 gb/GECG01008892.1/:1-2973(+)